MATWKPDPTFYPSPGSASEGPPEELAYVVTLTPGSTGDARPDALTVVDTDADSPNYGQIVGWADLPTIGDELPTLRYLREAGALPGLRV